MEECGEEEGGAAERAQFLSEREEVDEIVFRMTAELEALIRENTLLKRAVAG